MLAGSEEAPTPFKGRRHLAYEAQDKRHRARLQRAAGNDSVDIRKVFSCKLPPPSRYGQAPSK